MANTHDADVLLMQELLRGPELKDSMIAGANSNLCHAIVNPSIRTQAGGLSAGTAFWSRWACGMEMLAEAPSLKIPCPERLACAHWGGRLHKGIIVASIYFYDDSSL